VTTRCLVESWRPAGAGCRSGPWRQLRGLRRGAHARRRPGRNRRRRPGAVEWRPCGPA